MDTEIGKYKLVKDSTSKDDNSILNKLNDSYKESLIRSKEFTSSPKHFKRTENNYNKYIKKMQDKTDSISNMKQSEIHKSSSVDPNFRNIQKYKISSLDINQQLHNNPQFHDTSNEQLYVKRDNVIKNKNKRELISTTDDFGNVYVTRADATLNLNKDTFKDKDKPLIKSPKRKTDHEKTDKQQEKTEKQHEILENSLSPKEKKQKINIDNLRVETTTPDYLKNKSILSEPIHDEFLQSA